MQYLTFFALFYRYNQEDQATFGHSASHLSTDPEFCADFNQFQSFFLLSCLTDDIPYMKPTISPQGVIPFHILKEIITDLSALFMINTCARFGTGPATFVHASHT